MKREAVTSCTHCISNLNSLYISTDIYNVLNCYGYFLHVTAPQARLGRRRGGRLVQGVEEVLNGRGEREERHSPDEQSACAHQRLLQQVDHRLHLQNSFISRQMIRKGKGTLCPLLWGL